MSSEPDWHTNPWDHFGPDGKALGTTEEQKLRAEIERLLENQDLMQLEIESLRAEVERLRGVIYRNCDEMEAPKEDAAIIGEIARRKALEGK